MSEFQRFFTRALHRASVADPDPPSDAADVR